MQRFLTSLFLYSIFFIHLPINAQTLKPGFNAQEYINQMLISIRTVKDSTYASRFPQPENYRMIYQSDDIGLDNSWDLWLNTDSIATISLRGTTEKQESWLENFYAAMIPATGTIRLDSSTQFDYSLSDDARAGIHVGWAVGLAFLANDIMPKIDSLYQTGIKDYIITGHSQGGAIAYLLTAYVMQRQLNGKLPTDIRFKTYCSAAPKPGNLYFAYSYESLTQNGWAYNVVNAADWVPEVPISIQTLDDFNHVNPFIHAEDIIKNQKPINRLVLKKIYKKLDSPTRKAQKNYRNYLGNLAYKMVNHQISGLAVPEYMNTNNYVRTGSHVILKPTAEYYEKYPNDSTQIFIHHFHEPYIYLAKKLGKPFYE